MTATMTWIALVVGLVVAGVLAAATIRALRNDHADQAEVDHAEAVDADG